MVHELSNEVKLILKSGKAKGLCVLIRLNLCNLFPLQKVELLELFQLMPPDISHLCPASQDVGTKDYRIQGPVFYHHVHVAFHDIVALSSHFHTTIFLFS